MSKLYPTVLVLDGPNAITGHAMIQTAPAQGTPAEIMERVHMRMGNNTVLLLTDAPPHNWAALVDDPEHAEWGSWRLTGGPAWHTARDGDRIVRLAVLSKVNPDNDPMLGATLQLTAFSHQMYAIITGVPFFADGGTTAGLLFEKTISTRGRDVLRNWNDKQAPAVHEQPWPGGGLWETSRPGEYYPRLQLDANAQYLWGVTGIYLPMDALEHTGAIPWAKGTVGLLEISVPPNPAPQLPHPCGRDITSPGRRWVAHPTAQLLAEFGYDIEISDSWTCPSDRSRRVLDPWYACLRDARAAVMHAGPRDTEIHAVGAAIKDTYSRGVSHLGKSADRRWYRPDWQAILFASARVKMWRALWTAGSQWDMWPVCLKADAAFYEHRDAAKAFKIGPGIGEWKVTDV